MAKLLTLIVCTLLLAGSSVDAARAVCKNGHGKNCPPPPVDTQAPSIPQNLAGTASSSSINLTWSSSTDNVRVVGYKVLRNGAIIASNVTTTAYTDTGLAASTSYSYSVSAFDAAGNQSAQSPPVSVTTLAAPPPSAVGPTGPVGPQASITCTGVALTATMNIQTAVDANASGTTFCLSAGTYARAHIVPKDGDKFIGAVGAILDGEDITQHAIVGSASNVTVQNLIVQNYTAGYQDAPIFFLYTSGWKILNNEIRNNAGVGLEIGTNTLVQFNNIHHNREMGFGSDGGTGIVVDSNEIAFNNYLNTFDCSECGGFKLWATEGAKVTHNWSHDNHGPGMWDDFNNNNVEYAFNLVENNFLSGIHHEIGYNASIHDNVIRNNGKANNPAIIGTCNWLWCAAIDSRNSGGVNGGLVEIYNNTITPGSSAGNAVALIEQNADSTDASMGPWIVQNVYVHDNTIDLSLGGHSGAVQDNGNNAIFTSRNNRFDRNTYSLGTASGPLWWNNSSGTKAFWQGFGLDLNGTFH